MRALADAAIINFAPCCISGHHFGKQVADIHALRGRRSDANQHSKEVRMTKASRRETSSAGRRFVGSGHVIHRPRLRDRVMSMLEQ